jgi:DNA-binding protein H-NS
MTSLMDIQSQIEKLQKQASDIKAKEFDRTVLEIIGKMRAFGITLKDLQAATSRAKPGAATGKKRRAAAGKAPKKAAGSVPAKFRGPNGETWSGRGITPRWLAALIAEGRTKAEFAIPD